MAGVQMRGSFDALKQLKKRMDFVKSPAFRRTLLKNLSHEGLYQVAVSFDKEQDPYGVRWQRWARTPGKRRRGGKVLSDRGRLRNGFRAGSNAQTFTISNRVAYAAIHNYGGSTTSKGQFGYHNVGGRSRKRRGRFISKRTANRRYAEGKGATVKMSYTASGHVRGIPKRSFLPEQGRLGSRWTLAFTKVSALVMARALGQQAKQYGADVLGRG